jgi:hypothetical protein
MFFLFSIFFIVLFDGEFISAPTEYSLYISKIPISVEDVVLLFYCYFINLKKA